MYAITWEPGTNPEMDNLFDQLREAQYNRHEDRLWKNYSKDSFVFAVALTIVFDDNNNPEACSSIATRDCWPQGAYRILNRWWKHTNRAVFPRNPTPGTTHLLHSQLEWLKANTNYKLYFISRDSPNWGILAAKQFNKIGIPFDEPNNTQYLTCPNECDDSCWQTIIYHGDKDLLTTWKSRPAINTISGE